MYCTSCGKQIANDSVFCGHCGKPVHGSGEFDGLVAAARMGSQDAVSTLYEKTYSKVYYTVKSMIRDEDAVFDIVQDAYIKAFGHLDSFQGDAKFLPWVRQIAANTARDWLKKKRPMLFTELGSGDVQDTPVEELFPDERSEHLPDQIIDQKETKRLIREIIEELPEDQRAAIGMFYYQEMSVKEIAAAMEVSESAVKSRLMYGRNKIEKKVLELEKQGTKLYSLAPLPFLLLLFRNLETYATEVSDGRILHALLALQPVGAATAATGAGQSAGTAGSYGDGQGAGSSGTAVGAGQSAGTAGAAAGAGQGVGTAGGLGALKIGLIVLAAMAVGSLGTFGAIQIASRFGGDQESSAVEDAIDREEPDRWEESKGQEEPVKSEEPGLQEAPEEPDPIGEALEQYRIIIGQADSYEYNTAISDLEAVGYRYALVQMQPDDLVPTLLLEMESDTFINYVRIFQYDPDTKTVRQPAETVSEGTASVGGYRGGLTMAGDGGGMISTEWSSGTGETSISRIILNGDSLNRDILWTGLFDQIPDSITHIGIEWHEIGDLSALEGWTAPDSGAAEPSESGALPTDGDRIVLTGTVGTFDYDDIVALQGEPDPNGFDESSVEYSRSQTYRVIVLDTPQTLYLESFIGDAPYNKEVLLIRLDGIDGMEQYEGRHITFSIDPDNAWWPTDTSLPFGQPYIGDIHILE